MEMVVYLFNNFYNYLFLLPILFYNFFSKKARPIFLLIISLLFFFVISSKLIICLIITILSVYFGSILIDKKEEEKNKKLEQTEEKKTLKETYKRKEKHILITVIVINILFLFLFKYLKFFTINTNDILKLLNINYHFKVLKFIAPIGISFYTLQALSYIFDVYNGKIKAEKNILKVALFVSFFPQIMEGPIARYSETSELYNGNKITYDNFIYGLERIGYGLFKKIIIADRINILVEEVFKNYALYSGFTVFIGALGYTIMLYMEFSSSIDVVLGIMEMFGIKPPENFRQPFFSKDISEFWTRWHISLGAWLRDYIYYPISLSKKMRNLTSKMRSKLGNHFGPLISSIIALFIVWLLNGLWHGAGWTFILFGMYHFVLITLGKLFEPLIIKICSKFKINREKIVCRVLRSVKVFILVVFGELIFRANSMSALGVMTGKLLSFSFDFKELSLLKIDMCDLVILIIALIVVFIISILKEKGVNIREKINEKNTFIKWLIFYILIFSIFIFGAYGAGYEPVSPIYVDF